MLRLLALALCSVAGPAVAQAVVTSLTIPVGSSVHVTINDILSDGSTKPVPAANSDWTSTGTIQVGTIDLDPSNPTGWIFTGTAPGTAKATGIDLVNNVTGPELTVTVTPANSPPTITGVQYTSP